MLEYQLHNEGTPLSVVFGELERNRESLKIEEYSVSQTTLDQVSNISHITVRVDQQLGPFMTRYFDLIVLFTETKFKTIKNT